MPNKSTCEIQYIPAVLKENKEWYLDYMYQGADGKLKRGRHYINNAIKRLRTLKEKRAYGLHECEVINAKLRNGWTPLMDRAISNHPKGGTSWRDVFVAYREKIAVDLERENLRKSGAQTYLSDLGLLEDWITCATVPDRKMRHKKVVRETERLWMVSRGMSVSETTETERKQTERITYIYQLDKDAWEQWLKWSKEEREVGTTTLKNLRRWASMFGVWLTERGYMSENPLTDVKVEVDRKTQREENEAGKKKYISKDDRKRIWAWLDEHDKPMLLASYLCYYCMIRPKEMMQLRVYMVSVKNSLLSVPKEISKTHHDDVVTIPDVVMKLMIDMGVLNHDGEWLLFDKDLLPAPAHTHINNGEALRDRWAVMKKALRLPNSMWFYHLKHTGITDLAMVLPPRQVQLQARHHSLEMTERYMQPAQPVANEDIKKYV